MSLVFMMLTAVSVPGTVVVVPFTVYRTEAIGVSTWNSPEGPLLNVAFFLSVLTYIVKIE